MARPTLEALKFCVFSAIQVALVAMDLEERILADEFTIGGIRVRYALCRVRADAPGILGLFLPEDWPDWPSPSLESAFSAGVLSVMLWSLGALYQKLRGREGLGFGDVKMVGMIGAFQGLGRPCLRLSSVRSWAVFAD